MQSGDVGARVRDLHTRLHSLGFAGAPLENDAFDAVTTSLVEAFQRSRGLPLTGVVDTVTWQRLEEAGWRLGDRLLYLTKPYLRGDDVAELQVRLSALGFDPGRIDGLFGPLLHHALSEFQGNCALPVDGTLTRRTLLELRRVTPSAHDRVLVSDVRQGSVPQRLAGPLVLHGTSPLVDALLATMPSCVYSAQYATGPIDAFALWANEAHARCVVSIIESPVPGIGLHYWSGYQSFSQEGERLASSLAAALSNTTISQRLSVSGMALPVLRETQMTSLHVEHGPLGDDEANTITAVIAETLGNFFHSHN